MSGIELHQTLSLFGGRCGLKGQDTEGKLHHLEF